MQRGHCWGVDDRRPAFPGERLIFSFSILAWSVVGFRPRISAAQPIPQMRPPACTKAVLMAARSPSANVEPTRKESSGFAEEAMPMTLSQCQVPWKGPGPLDDVLQFPHVAGSVVLLKTAKGRSGQIARHVRRTSCRSAAPSCLAGL